MSDKHANDNSDKHITLPKHDYALPFMLDNLGVNGRLVHLSDSVTEILAKHNYPDPIARLLSELLIFVSLLGSNLKSQGIITAEIKSDKGIAKLLLVDYLFGGDIRGYCNFDRNAIIHDELTFHDLIASGFLIITLDLGENFERYQGIVEIKGNSLSECLMQYLESSQQITAQVKVVVAEHKIGNQIKWIANGILIQKLPKSEVNRLEVDAWDKLDVYIKSITDEEMTLLDITAEELLHRLFHEEQVWVYKPSLIQHKCRCTHDKMQNIVNTIPDEDKSIMINEQGKIEIICQFCNHKELFT